MAPPPGSLGDALLGSSSGVGYALAGSGHLSAPAQRAALSDDALGVMLLRSGTVGCETIDWLLDELASSRRACSDALAEALCGELEHGTQMEAFLQLKGLPATAIKWAIRRCRLSRDLLEELVAAAAGEAVPRRWHHARPDIADALVETQPLDCHQTIRAARAWPPRQRAAQIAAAAANAEVADQLRGSDASARPACTDAQLATELVGTLASADGFGDVASVLHEARSVCALRAGVATHLGHHPVLTLAGSWAGLIGVALDRLVARCSTILEASAGHTPALRYAHLPGGRFGFADDDHGDARCDAQLGPQAELALCHLLERPEATRSQRRRIWELLEAHGLLDQGAAQHLRVHPHALHDGIDAGACTPAQAQALLDGTWRADSGRFSSAAGSLWVHLATQVDATGCRHLLELIDRPGANRLHISAWARLRATFGERLNTVSLGAVTREAALLGVAATDRPPAPAPAATELVDGRAAKRTEGTPGGGTVAITGNEPLAVACSGPETAAAIAARLAGRFDTSREAWQLCFALADELDDLSVDDFADTVMSLAGSAS